ncbi:cadherin-24 isoform X3 [Sciurus carolinensis]|uniref:cadherin-24 isoform X3 n=1 Tax=Sciurus carolinensis TaxID=30640 RepID=UPI001FB4123C|nr:cadherin-24 isoform X3 [Sciurus carolinensis]
MWGLVRLLLAWLGGWGCMGRLAAPVRAWAGSRGRPGPPLLRTRRSWVWNQFFVIEEYAGPEPVLIGKLHSDVDRGEGRTKYLLTGEGAGTVFVIDEATGNIHVTKSLDREEKAQYVLLAQAVDRASNRPLEPPSEFIIKVQDINDNPPVFPLGPYHATVPEMSNVGTSVIQVTAHDADDPSYGNSAKLVYTVLDGLPFFSVDPQTGVVRTAIPNMDRETQEEFLVVIQAKDMGGHMGGLSGSTTVTVTLSDVNDNPPKFPQSLYQFSVVETAGPGTLVGRLQAQDPDLGDNALMAYSILDGEGSEAFSISTDAQGRDGLLTVRKPLDFETHRSYSFRVEATNTLIDPAYLRRGPFKDVASVRVTVQDAPEPPAFTQAAYHLAVMENKAPGTLVGQVSAADLDSPASPIRYSILPHSDPEHCFSIEPEDGTIRTAVPLDRETRVWYNLTVLATELDSSAQASRVQVAIQTLDENDNAPQLAEPYDTFVCDSAAPGQLIQVIRALDRDDVGNSSRVSLQGPLGPDTNFTVQDNRALVVLFVALRRQKQEALMVLEEEDVRENIITYDDEGGGEEDTEAFDITALQNPDGAAPPAPGPPVRRDVLPRARAPRQPRPPDLPAWFHPSLMASSWLHWPPAEGGSQPASQGESSSPHVAASLELCPAVSLPWASQLWALCCVLSRPQGEGGKGGGSWGRGKREEREGPPSLIS